MILRIMMCCFLLAFPCALQAAPYQDRAFYEYQQGEKTQDAEARKASFNKALELYLQQLSDHPSGELLYNIGNCYYQLQEYGLALYYYYRAEKEAPRNEIIAYNIEVAKRKTQQKDERQKNIFEVLYELQRQVTLLELELILIGFCLFAFTFASLSLWFKVPFFRTLTWFSLLASVLCSASLIWRLYFSPIEAVVVLPTQLLCGPGRQYAQVEGDPVLVGEKVYVQEVSQGGEWLKIKRESGPEGYAAKENIRVI